MWRFVCLKTYIFIAIELFPVDVSGNVILKKNLFLVAYFLTIDHHLQNAFAVDNLTSIAVSFLVRFAVVL